MKHKNLPYVWVRVVRNQGDIVSISQIYRFSLALRSIAMKIRHSLTQSTPQNEPFSSEKTIRNVSYSQHHTFYTENGWFCHSIQKTVVISLVGRHVLS
jgi:hypothetical protein